MFPQFDKIQAARCGGDKCQMGQPSMEASRPLLQHCCLLSPQPYNCLLLALFQPTSITSLPFSQPAPIYGVSLSSLQPVMESPRALPLNFQEKS